MCAPTSKNNSDLDSLSSAVGQFSRTKYPDIYAGSSVDQAAGNLRLYVTDLSVGRKMVQEAKRLNPEINTDRVMILKSPFSLEQMAAQMRSIWSNSISTTLKVNTMSAAPDGTHMIVTVTGTPDFNGAEIAAKMVAALSKEDIQVSGPGQIVIPIIVVPGGPVHLLNGGGTTRVPLSG